MNTPIVDFVNTYVSTDPVRLHMPGHKGRPGRLGCEPYDITEVAGADALYEASGIIAGSETNASGLFGSGRTLYSTEGSSQCIRAMVHLAVTCRRADAAPVIVAARNAHRAFLHACALVDADVVWLWPVSDAAPFSLMSCPVTAAQLEEVLSSRDEPCCGVYVTSPDYLGQMQDIRALSEVCHRYGTPLLVDNAHGAYLHFLPMNESAPLHPLDLGADMCCDSAHKTLPVLTGGAYLHISKNAPAPFAEHAKAAMALYGSTSPSYLTLCSLDQCNDYLDRRIANDLSLGSLTEPLPQVSHETCASLHSFDETHVLHRTPDKTNVLCQASGNTHTLLQALTDARAVLRHAGFSVVGSDPLHLSLLCNGTTAGTALRRSRIEPEYAGPDALVLLFSPGDDASDVRHAVDILASLPRKTAEAAAHSDSAAFIESDAASDNASAMAGIPADLRPAAAPHISIKPRKVMSIREAVFAPQEAVPTAQSAGRIAASPTAFCPPAVPPVMPGERISADAAQVFAFYGYDTVWVVKQHVMHTGSRGS